MHRASTHPFRLASRFRFPERAGPELLDPAATHEAPDLSLTDATELLDWLEGNGLRAFDVELTPAGRMTVRWVE